MMARDSRVFHAVAGMQVRPAYWRTCAVCWTAWCVQTPGVISFNDYGVSCRRLNAVLRMLLQCRPPLTPSRIGERSRSLPLVDQSHLGAPAPLLPNPVAQRGLLVCVDAEPNLWHSLGCLLLL